MGCEPGFEIITEKPGDGVTYPKPGQVVIIHYTAILPNGQKVDSSRDRDKPFSFKIGVGEVIKGWDEGIAQMSVGEKAILKCSGACAYGKTGYPGVIPPNCDMTFEIELISIK